MSARIIIFGGHGRIALLTISLLHAAGHKVSAVVRNPAHVGEVYRAGARPIVNDVELADERNLVGLIASHDTVIWSAGAGGGDPARTTAVDCDAAIRSMRAAVRARARRYLMVSYVGSGIDDVAESDSFYTYSKAKARADEYLRSTSLDWTVLGPSRLTDEAPTGRISLGTGHGTVSRADVAEVIIAAIGIPRTIGATVRFSVGDTPIADALAQL